MCFSEDVTTEEITFEKKTDDLMSCSSSSSLTTTTTDDDDDDTSSSSSSNSSFRRSMLRDEKKISKKNTFTNNNRVALIMGCIFSLGKLIFSFHLPHFLTPTMSKILYVPAFWSYDSTLSIFDNTFWTYGTDYGLMIIMFYLAFHILKFNPRNNNNLITDNKLRRRTASLLICYGISVGTGGLAHHFFLTVESRNSFAFRFIWTLCVGTVTAASGVMGICGTEIARMNNFNKKVVVPEWFWIGYGAFTTMVCAMGYMSYQRPACDIFIAGTTQTLSTAYICGIIIYSNFDTSFRLISFLGFMMNAPLLPIYSLIFQYTNWSLARINATLHSWLCVSWIIQGLVLQHISNTTNNNVMMMKTNINKKKNL